MNLKTTEYDISVEDIENKFLYNELKLIKNLNFFGNVDCPLKRNFKEMVDEILDKSIFYESGR